MVSQTKTILEQRINPNFHINIDQAHGIPRPAMDTRALFTTCILGTWNQTLPTIHDITSNGYKNKMSKVLAQREESQLSDQILK